ncbi:sialoadhesin-like [Dendropsophus ebraccatus]|uniref:sialoadhesin-like n=1 Tax=Dendropsophus ebraccatus TaxID=150705 RepID=UPI003831E910
MRLSILIFCCLLGTCWTSDNFCIYQPRSVRVREGDTVTIPCSYTYPEDLKGKSQIIIGWGEHNGPFCFIIKESITDTAGNILDEYKERMSTVTHPDKRTASLIIRGWKPSDGTTFCCTPTMYRTDAEPFTWSDTYGTSLTLSDGRWVSQVDELMAVQGEEMIIPCHYPLKTLGEPQQVTWYTGDDERCSINNRKVYSWDPTRPGGVYPYSLVNFPEDVSLRIHRVQRYGYYCCQVDGKIQSRYGTELTITGSQSSSSFNVTQPTTITGYRGESVTLSCSYTSYMESNILGAAIYWRLGNLSGPYVYHPYKEMVYPGYRGRTEITGAADLHIQGLNMSDDSMYYCFVVIRVCTRSEKYQKGIQYGGGTRLTVTDPHNVSGDQRLVVIASISGAVLLLLLCVILVILKIKGVICKKKKVSYQMKTSDSPENAELTSEERPYCEILRKVRI